MAVEYKVVLTGGIRSSPMMGDKDLPFESDEGSAPKIKEEVRCQ